VILRKVIKFVATRCRILRLKCIKFNFVWGSAPDLAAGAIQRSPDLFWDIRGPASSEREGKGKEGRGKKEREKR